MKKRIVIILFIYTLLLSGCSWNNLSTERMEEVLPEETAIGESSLIEVTEPELSECIEYTKLEEPAFTFYMAYQSIDLYTYSIAPAGTEDWVQLVCTGKCYHDPWGINQYQIPYSGEECTIWRLKGEIIPEEIVENYGITDAEYSCRIWDNVELVDGETLICWMWQEEVGQKLTLKQVEFCSDCYNAFGIVP